MTARELDRRSRVVYVAGWGASLEQPSWALDLGVRLARAVVVSFEEAQAVAEAGAAHTGFPAVVQKFLLAPAAPGLPPVRSLLASWRLRGPGRGWEEL